MKNTIAEKSNVLPRLTNNTDTAKEMNWRAEGSDKKTSAENKDEENWLMTEFILGWKKEVDTCLF